ncbi:hypothetical protein MDA_GLEAN10005617 [Myotis davidii]|uniref:Uncharacterized protein n=1 Tax=Myotis davidii TaxID=225400 RepID=L5LAZ2_MYODS|nr:hypothetical protein MDA_GLEAN10005617 [Myotis davidii]
MPGPPTGQGARAQGFPEEEQSIGMQMDGAGGGQSALTQSLLGLCWPPGVSGLCYLDGEEGHSAQSSAVADANPTPANGDPTSQPNTHLPGRESKPGRYTGRATGARVCLGKRKKTDRQPGRGLETSGGNSITGTWERTKGRPDRPAEQVTQGPRAQQR